MKSILLTPLALTQFVSPSWANELETAPQVVLLNTSSQNASHWLSLISELSTIGVRDVVLQDMRNENKYQQQPSQSRPLYVGYTKRGIVVTHAYNSAAVPALKRLVSGQTMTEAAMRKTVSEAEQMFGSTVAKKLEVDKHGFLRFNADIWATILYHEKGSVEHRMKRPTWVFLSKGSTILDTKRRMMMYRTIGAVSLQLLGEINNSSAIAHAIAHQIGHSSLSSKTLKDSLAKR